MRDEAVDRLARNLGASRRTTLLSAAGLALAGLAGAGAATKSSAKSKAKRPRINVKAPDLGAVGASSAKKKKTIPVSRCNCYQYGTYLLGQGEMFCFYETTSDQDESACNAEARVCAELGAACRNAEAERCIDAVVGRWL